ncbi:hypothetical protein VNO78_08976 [Psophocarpus tetragonolobus]|uniref:Uncharacterized protein n=1 Tax=Psophocarpus tetragonolobus TaxID=3891 RepID=A0AAN9SYT2_PSOTE
MVGQGSRAEGPGSKVHFQDAKIRGYKAAGEPCKPLSNIGPLRPDEQKKENITPQNLKVTKPTATEQLFGSFQFLSLID